MPKVATLNKTHKSQSQSQSQTAKEIRLNNGHSFLDTLAQLRKPNDSKGYSAAKTSFQKRAKYKAISDAIVYRLIDLDSPLNKSYWSAYHCTRTVLQDGNILKAKYCNQRFCLVCNRIRSAKLINGYTPSIETLKNPYFVTLTIKNVKDYDLKQSIQDMQRNFVRVKDTLRKQGIKLVGLRKVEVTYNPKTNEYHPHFHCIIDGCKPSFALIAQWLRVNPTATIKGQDVRYANTDLSVELFKYFTKMLTNKSELYPEAMDRIFRAMKGKRVFQPFGGIKKQSEDVNPEDATLCDWKPEQVEIWHFEKADKYTDWYNASGEPLSEVELTDDTIRLINGLSP